ncbi:hypothetical protein CERSUDRAFT_115230, partial [Gelatoporia subvermispora B]
MRFSTAALPLLLATSSLAASIPGLIRTAARRDAIRARQAHIQRDLVDVCAGLDVDLTLDLIKIDGKPLVAGHLDVCLCISLLPDFIKVDVVAQAAVALVGETQVLAILEGLINGDSGKQECHYPAHASPVCSFDTPCGFSCGDGFTPYTPPGASSPTDCVCEPPYTVCNGQCGNFPHGCGSSTPKRRRAPTCASGRSVCGVTGGSYGQGWECVDTTSDLESCGGCMAPSPFGGAPVNGVDCSALPNVDRVACKASRCVVSTCVEGYSVSSGNDSCVLATPVLATQKRDLVGAYVNEALDAIVPGVAAVAEHAVADVHVARDIADAFVPEALKADVAHVAHVAEAGVAKVHVGRDLVGAYVNEALDAVVPGVAAVAEHAVADVHVARGLVDAFVPETLDAVVPGVAAVAEDAVADVHVARDVPLVSAVVDAVADVVV